MYATAIDPRSQAGATLRAEVATVRSCQGQSHGDGGANGVTDVGRPQESHIGDWSFLLKRFRTLHGLTQERIGDMFGVSQRTVSRWERSENKPSPECQRRLRGLELEAPQGPWNALAGPAGQDVSLDDWLAARGAAFAEERLRTIIIDRVLGLLDQLAAEEIAKLPATDRQRLAERCRQVAALAEGSAAEGNNAPGPAEAERKP